ncbi:MAG: hypothetical protein V3T61_09215 [Acidobacteriota bacterium]
MRVIFLCLACLWLASLSAQTTGPIPQPSQQRTRSTLLNFIQSSTPCTVEEELRIARYLKRRTESSLKLAEEIDLEALAEDPDIDEKLAAELDLRLNNLKASQKEIVEALKMVERLIEQFPAEYAQTGPILWLTVIKDIATEKKNARELKELGYVESNWSSMVEVALPNLFTRILEPKISKLLKIIRREDLVPQTR